MEIGSVSPGMLVPSIDEQIAIELGKIRAAIEKIEELNKSRVVEGGDGFITPFPLPVLPQYEYEYGCKKCGVFGTMGYVCPRADCPSRVYCSSDQLQCR